MKRGILIVFLALMLSAGASANWSVKRNSPAAYADVELPFRCQTPSSTEKHVSTTIVLGQDDFVLFPIDIGDKLPRYSVNGYTFKRKPVDQALCGLLESAGIKVVAPPGEYVELDGKKIKGELASVVQQLTEFGEVFYRYKDSLKTLILSRRAEYGVHVPHNKAVLMAVLDALRGEQISDLTVDWETYQIRMNVSAEELKKAKKLIQQILDDSYMLAADVVGYQVLSSDPSGWQGVVTSLAGRLASSNRSLVGRTLVLASQSMLEDFLAVVRKFYRIEPVVAGETVVPNGWQMRFNIGECSNYTLPYSDLSILMQTKIKNHRDLNTKVTLVSSKGPMSTFNIRNMLNQEVALVGIPVDNVELMFLLRFNLIRFVQKGERHD